VSRIGVIGGSGLYKIEGLEHVRFEAVKTPYGEPSDEYILGRLGDKEVVFLPRHGRNHRLLPGELPSRANIWGFKKLGVEWIISLSAVGSMKEQYAPRDFVLVDQFFDRTKERPSSFFGDGVIAHIAFAHPICPALQGVLFEAGGTLPIRLHRGGTYVCMEGPAFSTLAESRIYRSWGVDVIGMTNLPEAKLAREAEICYATVALVTDYDCWHPEHDAVTVEQVIGNLQANAANAKALVREAVARVPDKRACACKDALKSAMFTPPEAIPPRRREELAPILERYLPQRNGAS
jgi:5'-methylthioadenosine phosphorylase